MNQYVSVYLETVKKNILLFMIIFVILIFTSNLWLGYPLILIGDIISSPKLILILFPLLSASLLSLGFLYTNFIIAKKISDFSGNNTFNLMIILQAITILISFIIIFIGYIIIIKIVNS